MESAWALCKTMVGAGQVVIPSDWSGLFESMGSHFVVMGEYHGKPLAILMAIASVAWLLPNTRELFPDVSLDQNGLTKKVSLFRWKASVLWLLITIAGILISLWNMSHVSEFLYYQF